MIEQLYEILFTVSLICFSLLIFVYLFRTIMGPTFYDRIVAVSCLSTVAIVMICILAVIQGEQYLVDVAIIYAVLGFLTIVIVSKAYLRSHNKDKEKDYSNLKGSNDND